MIWALIYHLSEKRLGYRSSYNVFYENMIEQIKPKFTTNIGLLHGGFGGAHFAPFSDTL
jgi:hypothetical protein